MNEQSFDSQWTLQEALVALLFLAASADGDLDKVEQGEILALQRRSKAFRALKPHELTTLNRKMVDSVRYGGLALAHTCAALPTDARLPAFALALDLMLSNGELTDKESEFVDTLRLKLDLKSGEVARIAEAMAIRHSI